jgi:hypothetical protein
MTLYCTADVHRVLFLTKNVKRIGTNAVVTWVRTDKFSYHFSGFPCSRELSRSIRRACEIDAARRYGKISEEHLLLALTDDPNAQLLFVEVGVDFNRLRDVLSHRLHPIANEQAGVAELRLSETLETKCQEAATVAIEADRTRLHSMVLIPLLAESGGGEAAQVLNAFGISPERAVEGLLKSYPRGIDAPPIPTAVLEALQDQRPSRPSREVQVEVMRSSNPSTWKKPLPRQDTPVVPQLFICYRREKDRHSAGRLYQLLDDQFKDNLKIVMDVDVIPPGVDFVKFINDAIIKCRVFVAIIGEEWLTCRDGDGAYRILKPDDYVRHEIAIALRSNIPAFPLCIDNAQMPRETDLPDNIRPLARIQAFRVRHETFRTDVTELVRKIDEVLGFRGALPSILRPRG